MEEIQKPDRKICLLLEGYKIISTFMVVDIAPTIRIPVLNDNGFGYHPLDCYFNRDATNFLAIPNVFCYTKKLP